MKIARRMWVFALRPYHPPARSVYQPACPSVTKEAKKDAIPFEFALIYNGPGRWKYGLGFVEFGAFIGGTGGREDPFVPPRPAA
jgi:hypothetical protein